MYVVPFLMGPPGSRFSKVGVEITDSKYVVLNMRIMTRMGRIALDALGNSPDFNRGLHSTLDLDPEKLTAGTPQRTSSSARRWIRPCGRN